MEIGEDGKCKCKSGYMKGENICYKCHQQCHINADCISPGKCVCKEGFKGDGVTCYSLTPKVVKISPLMSIGSERTEVTVYLSENIPKDQEFVYCKFGSSIVNSRSFSGKIAKCLTPPHISETVSFSFSYDQIHWSEESIEFSFIKKSKIIELSFSSIFLILAIISIIGLFLFKYYRKGNNPDEEQEMEPLLNQDDEPTRPFIQKRKSHLD